MNSADSMGPRTKETSNAKEASPYSGLKEPILELDRDSILGEYLRQPTVENGRMYDWMVKLNTVLMAYKKTGI